MFRPGPHLLRQLLAVVIVLLATGCQPRTTLAGDPLQWTVVADNLDELDAWMDETVPLMGPELGGEFATCVQNLRFKQDGNREAKSYALLHALQGKSVRDVLIAGHRLANDEALARMSNQTAHIADLMKLETLAPEERARREAFHRARIAAYQRILAAGEKRLAELRDGAAAP